MADPLEDARAKVDRAGEHIKALEAEVRRFSTSRPYTVTGNPDLKTGEYVLRIKPKEPPKRISVLISDVLNNLRPSLDYLVGALAVLEGGQIKETHQFPICDSPALFKAELAKGRLAGLPDDHVALIEKLQPYKGRKAKVWLRLLREYSNPDKHRHLSVLLSHIEGDFSVPSPPTVQIVGEPIGNSNAAVRALMSAIEAMPKLNPELGKAAQTFARSSGASNLALAAAGYTPRMVPSVSFDPELRSSAIPQTTQPPPKRNVQVELSVSVGVAFPEGTPVVETMQLFESQVAKTLDAFQPLFD